MEVGLDFFLKNGKFKQAQNYFYTKSGARNTPRIGAKRLTSGRFTDPPGNLENRGQETMISPKR